MSEYIAGDLRRRVREHFADCCAYCRSAEELTVVTFEIEHIVPRSQGGTSVFDNLCFACPMCNRHKSDRVRVVDAQSGTSVVLFHPQRDRWEDHFAWSADFTEIVPRTPCGRATVEALQMNRPQLIRVRKMWVTLNEHPPDERIG